MKFIVTGGAGFVGSSIIKRLNSMGHNDILLIDKINKPEKVLNIRDLKFKTFCDYENENLELYLEDFKYYDYPRRTETVLFHQGACSDTMENDSRLIIKNNYTSTLWWLSYCNSNKVRMIYASSAAVYGHSKAKSPMKIEDERPANVYGLSKKMIDDKVKSVMSSATTQLVGLRYFNVYGPGEFHKKQMASTALQFFDSVMKKNSIALFQNSDAYFRDFIHVEDVVDVNMFFLQNKHLSGIFNCGTGVTTSFDDIAKIVSSYFITKQITKNVEFEVIEMPEKLKKVYQQFTQADISGLRQAGFKKDFTNVHDGTMNYLSYLTGLIESNDYFY